MLGRLTNCSAIKVSNWQHIISKQVYGIKAQIMCALWHFIRQRRAGTSQHQLSVCFYCSAKSLGFLKSKANACVALRLSFPEVMSVRTWGILQLSFWHPYLLEVRGANFLFYQVNISSGILTEKCFDEIPLANVTVSFILQVAKQMHGSEITKGFELVIQIHIIECLESATSDFPFSDCGG